MSRIPTQSELQTLYNPEIVEGKEHSSGLPIDEEIIVLRKLRAALALGKDAKDAVLMTGQYDVQRLPITHVVLHHTVTPTDTTWKQLSTIGKSRGYVDYPHSYHYDPETGEETFIQYHWLVYTDGTIRECMNTKDDIAWHAGDWEMNRKSIGLAFVGDFRTNTVTDEMLRNLALKLIPYDRAIGGSGLTILGHREISQTACPANVLDYRNQLVDYINNPPAPPSSGDEKTDFDISFITTEQRWPNGEEVQAFTRSGKLPYQFVQDEYLHPRIANYEKRTKAAEQAVADISQQLTEVQGNYEWEKDRADTNANLLSKSEKELSECKSALEGVEDELLDTKAQMANIQKTYMERINALQKTNEALDSANEKLADEVVEKTAAVNGLTDTVEMLEGRVASLEKQAEDLKRAAIDNMSAVDLIAEGIRKLFSATKER